MPNEPLRAIGFKTNSNIICDYNTGLKGLRVDQFYTQCSST